MLKFELCYSYRLALCKELKPLTLNYYVITSINSSTGSVVADRDGDSVVADRDGDSVAAGGDSVVAGGGSIMTSGGSVVAGGGSVVSGGSSVVASGGTVVVGSVGIGNITDSGAGGSFAEDTVGDATDRRVHLRK